MKQKLNYDNYKKQEEKYHRYVGMIASIRMLLFIGMIISFIGKYYYFPLLLTSVFIICSISFLCFVFLHDYYYKKYDYYFKYVTIMDTYLARLNGEWKNFTDTGSDFLTEKKNYLADLDILGNCSLFQYLSICKTLGGRKRLCEKLSNQKLSPKNLELDQELVTELAKKVNFVIDFQVALSFYDQKKIHLSNDFDSLKVGTSSRKTDLVIAMIGSLLVLLFLALSIFHVISYRYFYAMFLFNFALSFFYSLIYQKEFREMTNAIRSLGGLKAIFSSVTHHQFSSKKMDKIKKEMDQGLTCISKLGWIDTLASLKNNFLSNFIFNGFFCLNLILLYQFSEFMTHQFSRMKKSMEDLEELEAMISLAGIGIMKEVKCMPVMEDVVGITFQEIKHPLLEEKVCVANDFSSLHGIQIITGSNMGGKTSFLRTIGINLILMNAGSYVCANSFRASYFKIFTSMRISDDIEKGISTFYGELLRMKEAIEYVDKGNMLVLIDEIFKGTNYQDRIYGAKEVMKRLNTKQTIVFVTTHDFELCEEKNVLNYHVKEYYEGNQIYFDYKIRKGRCTSTNAKYLMKQLGIIE